MKFAIVIAVVLAAGCTGNPVGFYDVNRVVTESRVARQMFAAAEEATSKRDEARRAIDQYGAESKTPLAAAELQRRHDQVQQLIDAANADAKKAHDAAGAKLDARLAMISGRLAIAHRMRFVMSISGPPPFAEPGVDLTGELIAELDGLPPEVARARAAAVAAQEHARQLDNEATAAAAASMAAQVVQQ